MKNKKDKVSKEELLELLEMLNNTEEYQNTKPEGVVDCKIEDSYLHFELESCDNKQNIFSGYVIHNEYNGIYNGISDDGKSFVFGFFEPHKRVDLMILTSKGIEKYFFKKGSYCYYYGYNDCMPNLTNYRMLILSRNNDPRDCDDYEKNNFVKKLEHYIANVLSSEDRKIISNYQIDFAKVDKGKGKK